MDCFYDSANIWNVFGYVHFVDFFYIKPSQKTDDWSVLVRLPV